MKTTQLFLSILIASSISKAGIPPGIVQESNNLKIRKPSLSKACLSIASKSDFNFSSESRYKNGEKLALGTEATVPFCYTLEMKDMKGIVHPGKYNVEVMSKFPDFSIERNESAFSAHIVFSYGYKILFHCINNLKQDVLRSENQVISFLNDQLPPGLSIRLNSCQ